MLSVFNVAAAEGRRLKTGFWPLFFGIETVVFAVVGTWMQAASWQLGDGSNENVGALLPWVGTSSLFVGVTVCNALLRGAVTRADSNYLRSTRDRLVSAAVHVLLSLVISAAVVCLGVATGLIVRALFGFPFVERDPVAMLAWICQAAMVAWLECLVGLCIGYASRSFGAAAVTMALVSLGVPGGILALPVTACGFKAAGTWLVENQPNTWFAVLARDGVLNGPTLAVVTVFCAVLVFALLVIAARRKLK